MKWGDEEVYDWERAPKVRPETEWFGWFVTILALLTLLVIWLAVV